MENHLIIRKSRTASLVWDLKFSCLHHQCLSPYLGSSGDAVYRGSAINRRHVFGFSRLWFPGMLSGRCEEPLREWGAGGLLTMVTLGDYKRCGDTSVFFLITRTFSRLIDLESYCQREAFKLNCMVCCFRTAPLRPRWLEPTGFQVQFS